MKLVYKILFGLTGLFGVAGCTSIDCPLDNVVVMQCNFYATETQSPLKLDAVLTVKAANRDTVLLNQATAINSMLLPLKQTSEPDTLLLNFTNKAGQSATDTLFVDHFSHPHFESVDCPVSVFHTIKTVRATSHPLSQLPLTVDSVSLVRSIVNYDDIENVRIFLRSTSSH